MLKYLYALLVLWLLIALPVSWADERPTALQKPTPQRPTSLSPT